MGSQPHNWVNKRTGLDSPRPMRVWPPGSWLPIKVSPYENYTANNTVVLGDKNYVEVRFRVQGHGTSLLSSGRLGGFTTLRSSDCVNVIVWTEDQGSPEQAKEEMEKRIRGASKVVEQVSLFDPHG